MRAPKNIPRHLITRIIRLAGGVRVLSCVYHLCVYAYVVTAFCLLDWMKEYKIWAWVGVCVCA